MYELNAAKILVHQYSFKIWNCCFSLFKRNCLIGSDTLYDGLYKLNLDNLCVETLMTLHHNVGTKLRLVDERSACGISIWDTFPKKERKD